MVDIHSLMNAPQEQRKFIGVVFTTEAARSTVESILAEQVGANIIIAAPMELLYDTTVSECLCSDGFLKSSMRFCHNYGNIFLKDERIAQPISFLGQIDELHVVAAGSMPSDEFDLCLSSSIEELLWKAMDLNVRSHYYFANGRRLSNLETRLEKRGVPDRVAVKDKERRECTSALKVVRVGCDYGSSGLWDEQGRMISYDCIDLPLPLIRRIICWHRGFDLILNEVISKAGASDEWEEKHECEKLEIAYELQSTLGAAIAVQIQAEQGWISVAGLDKGGHHIDFNDLRQLKEEKIFQYALNCDLKSFKRLIDVCCELDRHCELDEHSKWEISDGLKMVFDVVSQKNEVYVGAIEYYIQKDTPLNLNPNHLVGKLFLLLSDSEIFNMINKYDYNQKNSWLYAYYHELPSESITEKHLGGLCNFLTDSSDGALTSSSFRDVDFLEKYNIINKEAFINGCKIILEKMKYSPFMAHVYFDSLFNSPCNAPQAVIQKFNGNMDLLEEIYLALLSHDNNHDNDGKFLVEIYLKKPSILDKYINLLIDCPLNNGERNICFFKLNNFIDILDKIFNQFTRSSQPTDTCADYFLESLLLPSQNKLGLLKKQDEWIRHSIQSFYNEKTKMHCLFSVICKLKIERKKDYIHLFLKNNRDFKDFKNIPLIPAYSSSAGSIVPIYSEWIDFLTSLLPSFTGSQWLDHKYYVEKEIDSLKKQIELEQINEILRG